jgi:ketosteroid isomerase-like protein
LLTGCETIPDADQAKQEIFAADSVFAELSVAEGMATAFLRYMDENATIYQEGSAPITGREAIAAVYANTGEGSLHWEPTFIDAAASGDLGYSLGRYVYSYRDAGGEEQKSYGYYVSIWKKQADGSWKYVFDSGVKAPASEDSVD